MSGAAFGGQRAAYMDGNGRAGDKRHLIPPVDFSTAKGLVWPALGDPLATEILALRFQLERSQWWPERELRAAQFVQLETLLDHAMRLVPFYRDYARRTGYDRDRELTAESWAALPVLSRLDIQQAGPKLHSPSVPESHGAVTSTATSGATGVSVVTLKTALTQKFYEAATWREAIWHRRDLSRKFAVIKAPHLMKFRPDVKERDQASWGWPFARFFRTGRLVECDIFAPPERQLEWLIQERPDYLMSMPSNLRSIAEYARSHSMRMPPIREIRSYGEAFDTDLPKLCREVWGAKHTSLYSTQEVGIIASQCPDVDHFHCDAELTYVEVLDADSRPCRPGEVGRVVVTALHNFAMPLIRYDIGDLAEVGAPCSCGRGLPVLERVLGRRRSVLTLPAGGTRFVGSIGGMFTKIPVIVQRQVIQRTARDIEVSLVVQRALTAEEEIKLKASLAQRFGAEFTFTIAYVDDIARNRDGKYEDFRSDISA
jgi:phenylacetate-CoA ligase